MKKTLLSLFAIALTIGASAQTMVSTFPEGRNAVLEEFTGVGCVNCPDGHTRANALANAYPGRVVIINMHGSAYQGTPNLKSDKVDAIDDFAGASAYPCGTMNRVVWAGAYNVPPYFPSNPPNNLVIRRPGWWDTGYPGQTTGEYIILNGGNSVVNIGGSSTYNSTTSEVTVEVELYYTGDDTDTENLLNVGIMQDGVVGYQSGGGSNYTHNHIFRDFFTGQWGESITTTTTGSFITKTYTYTVPANYNGIASDIDNMDIVIYVTQSDMKTVHTGITFPAKDGTFVGDKPATNLNAFDFEVFPNPVVDNAQLHVNVEESTEVELFVTNTLGQVVASKNLGMITKGSKYVDFDANELGLTSGIYLVSLNSGEQTITKRMVVK